MSTLIVAGLMAFGLVAIMTAVFLAMDESKTSPTSTTASPKTASITTTTPQPVGPPAHRTEQRLPVIRKEAQFTTMTTQFSELSAQLRSLHEQAREVERRLSILSNMAEQIEHGKSRISVEETEDYRLPEPVDGARA